MHHNIKLIHQLMIIRKTATRPGRRGHITGRRGTIRRTESEQPRHIPAIRHIRDTLTLDRIPLALGKRASLKTSAVSFRPDPVEILVRFDMESTLVPGCTDFDGAAGGTSASLGSY